MKPASHRDQLVAMLCEAAEVEHCLMCTYLYGAFSLKQRTDEDLTAAELEAVRRWRATVIDIAIDEMLHLALVNNLLISLGATPHYGRYNFPSALAPSRPMSPWRSLLSILTCSTTSSTWSVHVTPPSEMGRSSARQSTTVGVIEGRFDAVRRRLRHRR